MVKVTKAANGSGMVTFDFNGSTTVKPFGAKVPPNTAASVPAGIVKDDEQNLTVIYRPEGVMGKGAFEIRLPSGWSAEEALVSGENKLSKNTVAVTFDTDYFGEGEVGR